MHRTRTRWEGKLRHRETTPPRAHSQSVAGLETEPRSPSPVLYPMELHSISGTYNLKRDKFKNGEKINEPSSLAGDLGSSDWFSWGEKVETPPPGTVGTGLQDNKQSKVQWGAWPRNTKPPQVSRVFSTLDPRPRSLVKGSHSKRFYLGSG